MLRASCILIPSPEISNMSKIARAAKSPSLYSKEGDKKIRAYPPKIYKIDWEVALKHER